MQAQKVHDEMKTTFDSVQGHPCHIKNGKFRLAIDRKDPKKPTLIVVFTNASGEPSRYLYVGGRQDSHCAYKISHLKSHGNYNNPALGLHGDAGQYGNPALEAARIKLNYQEDEGGDLAKLSETILADFCALIVKPENKDYVRHILPTLAKKMDQEDYTEEVGYSFLDSYRDMNGDFTTNIGTREYKDKKSRNYIFTTNLFTNANEDAAKKSYPEDKTLFGVSFDDLGIDITFMKKKEYRRPKIHDKSGNPIPDETFVALKENGLSQLPVAIYGSLRPTVMVEGTKLSIKIYLDTALVPIDNKHLASPGIVEILKSGGGSSSKPAVDPFAFAKPGSPAKRRHSEDEEDPAKRPKTDEEDEEVPTQPYEGSEDEGVGGFE